MGTPIRIIVHRSNTIFDIVLLAPGSAIRCERKTNKNNVNFHDDDRNDTANKSISVGLVCLNRKGFNAYFVSAYVGALMNSSVYRRAAFQFLLEFLTYKLADKPNVETILIRLRTPKKQFLDYKWNERITHLALERREVDYAMSWLSTLGGAFSALGEEFQHCAEMAGKISVTQFKLALRLGDPLLVARCKLYAALSFIQRGVFRLPKRIVRHVYKFALVEKDIRLQNMCLGIWAKLYYCYKLNKETRKSSRTTQISKKKKLFNK